MLARIWAFVQTKGGSGKSTLATNIAVQAEEAGRPVLLVDLDAQSSATLWGQQRGSKKPTVFEARPEKLAEIIRSATTLGVQQIIIDSPSKADAVQLAAIRAADLIICPVMVDLRNIYRPDEIRKHGFVHISVGRAPVVDSIVSETKSMQRRREAAPIEV